MDSIKGQFVVKLIAKLTADIPEVFHVNRDLGQLEFYAPGTKPNVSFPCILIKLTSSTYKERQQKTQQSEINVQLRLGVDVFSDTSNLAPDEVRTQGLLYFEIENKIYKSLQDWRADGLLNYPMVRVSDSEEIRNDPYNVSIINFKAGFEDGY
jgi:hypothetical protein